MGRGMSRASRLQRLEALLLNSSTGYTIQELADRLHVHRTTVWRDLNELSCEVPLQEVDNRYLIERDGYLPDMRFSRSESVMLHLAIRKMIQQQTNVSPLMVWALEKLTLALHHPSPPQLSESLRKLQASSPESGKRAQIWETLVRAWIEQFTTRITYQPFGTTVLTVTEIRPYLFEPALLSHGVYLIGFSLATENIHAIRVERIVKAVPTTEKFTRPSDAALDQMLRHLWGVGSGEDPVEVRLRFRDPDVAERVRDTCLLHAQEIYDLPDGGIIWSTQVTDITELIPWLCNWGSDCEVLAPPALRQQVSEDAPCYTGGMDMAIGASKKTFTFSDQFYDSLHRIKDGEQIRFCLQCGSCSGVCPFGYLMDYTPRQMVAALRAGIFDAVLDTERVWMCVSCQACAQVCPASIPLTEGMMTRAKEEMLLAGNVPGELQDALENTQRYGNPMGESPRKRAEWAAGLDPEVAIMAKLKRPVDVLWFVGDYASYHPRAQQATRAFAKILNALGVDFAILGPEESSDGDSQRLAGERGLFEMLAEENGNTFGKYEFGEIITTDPHAYNAIKNEYPALGIEYPVRHYTEFLVERLEQLKPHFIHPINATIAYHDPCYLGRVNGIYDEPRALLRAIPGVEIAEMAHTREASLCCGGGGGGMWLDGFQWEIAHVRLSELRVREALIASGANGSVMLPPEEQRRLREKARKRKNGHKKDEERPVQILAVACPYECPRFEDAAKLVQGADKLQIMDIAELLLAAMEVEEV